MEIARRIKSGISFYQLRTIKARICLVEVFLFSGNARIFNIFLAPYSVRFFSFFYATITKRLKYSLTTLNENETWLHWLIFICNTPKLKWLNWYFTSVWRLHFVKCILVIFIIESLNSPWFGLVLDTWSLNVFLKKEEVIIKMFC